MKMTCLKRFATVQVLERTLPDSGTGLAEWWAAHGSQDDSFASRTYAELIGRAGPAGERHATTISLSLDMKTAARQIRTAGGGLRGAAAVLRQEMSTLTAALRSAVVGFEWHNTATKKSGTTTFPACKEGKPALSPALQTGPGPISFTTSVVGRGGATFTLSPGSGTISR